MCQCQACRSGLVRGTGHAVGCRCSACRIRTIGRANGFEADEASRWQACDATAQTRIVGALPSWSGWCHTARLANIASDRNFLRTNRGWASMGQLPIYRLVPTAAQGRRRPLYIGQTYARDSSVAARIRQHLKPSNTSAESVRLRAFVRAAGGADRVLVQFGTVRTVEPRLAHAVEILLQSSERVRDWSHIRRTRTFDEVEMAVAGAVADLRRSA